MTDGAFRVIRDDGTHGTRFRPPRRAGVRMTHTTPQVRPMRPVRPFLSFSECFQRNEWDAGLVQQGTAVPAPVRRPLQPLKGPSL